MVPKNTFTFSGRVQRFKQVGGWHFVSIQERYADLHITKPRWGLVPALITVGDTHWKSSLLPAGDGSLFIALPARVRKSEGLVEGGRVSGSFTVQR